DRVISSGRGVGDDRRSAAGDGGADYIGREERAGGSADGEGDVEAAQWGGDSGGGEESDRQHAGEGWPGSVGGDGWADAVLFRRGRRGGADIAAECVPIGRYEGGDEGEGDAGYGSGEEGAGHWRS